jgi:hypothetical protein
MTVDQFINLRLMAHPVNWAIVWIVLLFGGLAWAVVHDKIQEAPSA